MISSLPMRIGIMRLKTAFIIILLLIIAAPVPAAQFCPSVSNCRATAPIGRLLHDPNSAGQRVWTTPCGPNTNGHSLDPICKAIATCTNAGGFGKFLQAVTGDCRAKHFDGYFGLDGMTFGILDWTWSNLPGVLKTFQQRAPAAFASHFGSLNLPMTNGCVDPNWTCTANQNANLMCESKFNGAFSSALKTAEFRKAQMEFALAEYEQRLSRYAQLGLKTEYGNTAMAVVANNLKRTASCKPSSWKSLCRGREEKAMVDCMLQQYEQNACRGSLRGSRSRVESIKAVFAIDQGATAIHPAAAAIEHCVPSWGQ